MAEGSKTVKFLWLNLMQNRRVTRFGKVVKKKKINANKPYIKSGVYNKYILDKFIILNRIDIT